jgi:toxin YhaV
MVVNARVNDDNAKRACAGSDDTYRVFKKLLKSGHPHDDWKPLLSQAELEGHRS